MTEKQDEEAFNETLKRMLKTPPKPHEKSEPSSGEGDATKGRTDERELLRD